MLICMAIILGKMVLFNYCTYLLKFTTNMTINSFINVMLFIYGNCWLAFEKACFLCWTIYRLHSRRKCFEFENEESIVDFHMHEIFSPWYNCTTYWHTYNDNCHMLYFVGMVKFIIKTIFFEKIHKLCHPYLLFSSPQHSLTWYYTT